jgi:hypothetical protein
MNYDHDKDEEQLTHLLVQNKEDNLPDRVTLYIITFLFGSFLGAMIMVFYLGIKAVL